PAALAVKPSEPMVRNLSNREYLSAMSDLLGEPLSLDMQKTWTPTTQFGGFDAVAWTNIDTKALRDLAEAVETVLDRAVVSPKVMTCSVNNADDLAYAACARSILERIASRGFGRPLAPEESEALGKTYDKGVALAKGSLSDPAAIFR